MSEVMGSTPFKSGQSLPLGIIPRVSWVGEMKESRQLVGTDGQGNPEIPDEPGTGWRAVRSCLLLGFQSFERKELPMCQAWRDGSFMGPAGHFRDGWHHAS